MRKSLYFLVLASLFALPFTAFGQQNGSIPWPKTETVCRVWSAHGATNLDLAIWADTLTTDSVAWRNHTLVFVLSADSAYHLSKACSLSINNRALFIRAEEGKTYAVPTAPPNYTYKPRLYCQTSAGAVLGAFVLVGTNDTIAVKNVAICGYDPFVSPTNIDAANANCFLTGTAASGASIFGDSLVISTFTGAVQINAYTRTVRIQNSIIGDIGTMVKSNFGAGRVFDGRTVECDTVDFNNNTIYNVIDRVIRRLTATAMLHNFYFDHNTVMNCMSYHGFIALGWIDSSAGRTFQIKNNLLVDNFFLGPDTDNTRQGEFTESGDLDSHNGQGKMEWITMKANPVNPNFLVSDNYYVISDSGKAVRNFVTPAHAVLYHPLTDAEPILCSQISTIVNNPNAFRNVGVQFTNAPQVMTKFAKWYFSPYALGYTPTVIALSSVASAIGDAAKIHADSAVGAGDNKLKYLSKPVDNFGVNYGSTSATGLALAFTDVSAQLYRWPYDYNRVRVDSVMDYLDCGYLCTSDLSVAATDGKVIGATNWTFNGTYSGVAKDGSTSGVPSKFSLSQNYPNPFNPSTKISYTLSKASQVSLKVYDLLGREVATLVNGMQTAESHVAVWDASHMASGVYFYKLVAGDFSQVKRMILMK
jgi:hypothetical protein